MATGVPLAAMYALSEPLLLLLGQSPEIAGAAAEFAYGLIPQIFAYAANWAAAVDPADLRAAHLARSYVQA